MKALSIISVFILAVLVATSCRPAAAPSPPPTASPVSTLAPAPTETKAPTPTSTSTPPPQPWRPALPQERCMPSETRACQVLFVLPAQYYAESGRGFPDQFWDAGYGVTIASDAPQVVEVCGNTVRAAQPEKDIPVDLPLAEVQVTEYDAIVFIGGLGCQDQWEDKAAHRIAREAVAQGKVLGAAGCASTILAHAGVLQGKMATICSEQPPVKHGQDYCAVLQSQGAVCSPEPITRDGLIVTADRRSPYFVAGVIEMIEEMVASTG